MSYKKKRSTSLNLNISCQVPDTDRDEEVFLTVTIPCNSVMKEDQKLEEGKSGCESGDERKTEGTSQNSAPVSPLSDLEPASPSGQGSVEEESSGGDCSAPRPTEGNETEFSAGEGLGKAPSPCHCGDSQEDEGEPSDSDVGPAKKISKLGEEKPAKPRSFSGTFFKTVRM